MADTWQLQDAKSHFSEVVKRATSNGPQIVTLRGVEAAVVLSFADYQQLSRSQPSLKDFLLAGPFFDDAIVDLLNERSPDQGREIDL